MAVAYGSAGTHAESNSDVRSLNVPYPSTVNADDILILHVLNQRGESFDSVTGFTQIAEANGSGAWYKVATGSETGNIAVGYSGGSTGEMTGRMFRFTGAYTTDPIDVSNSASSTTVTTITPTVTNGIFVWLAGCRNLTGTNTDRVSSYAMVTSDPTPWTEIYDQGRDNQVNIAGAYSAIRSAATATGNFTATYSGTAADTSGICFNVVPNPNATATPAVITLTATVNSPAVGASAVVGSAISLTTTVNAATASATDPKWVNTNKTDTSPTITNTPKS